jgi:hypothetical protein
MVDTSMSSEELNTNMKSVITENSDLTLKILCFSIKKTNTLMEVSEM